MQDTYFRVVCSSYWKYGSVLSWSRLHFFKLGLCCRIDHIQWKQSFMADNVLWKKDSTLL